LFIQLIYYNTTFLKNYDNAHVEFGLLSSNAVDVEVKLCPRVGSAVEIIMRL